MLNQQNINIIVLDEEFKYKTSKYVKSDRKITYTLVSSEHLENNMIRYEGYAGIIVD